VADSKGVWSNTTVESFTFTPVPPTDAMVNLADEQHCTKVVIGGQVYLLCGDKIFTITGSELIH